MSRALVTALVLIASLSTLGAQKREAPPRGPRFEVTVPPTVRGGAVTGRVYVMVARDNAVSRGCRLAAPARRSSAATSRCCRRAARRCWT